MTEERKYEPYDDRYFKLTKKELEHMDFLSLWYGFPYEAPFFGYGLVDGHTHPYAEKMKKEWEEIHGPMPPIIILDE